MATVELFRNQAIFPSSFTALQTGVLFHATPLLLIPDIECADLHTVEILGAGLTSEGN